ncbi:MAG: HAD family hydrolase [Actinomycetales bacterium]
MTASRLPAAVLWDMDGTIVDTEPYWIEAEHALVAEHGGVWTSEHADHLIGKDLRYSARYVREHGGVAGMSEEEIVHSLQDHVIARAGAQLDWRPGARELIAALSEAGVPQALVTMSWTGLAAAVAAHLPAGTFSTIVSGDLVENGKPHPEPYQLAMARLGVGSDDVVAIEDSPTGAASAAAAGVHVVCVPYLAPVDGTLYRLVPDLATLTPHTLLPE